MLLAPPGRWNVGVAAARIRRGVDLRPVTGLGAGDVLVGRADIGPLRVQVRVVAVGARQGAFQRLGGSATGQGQHEDRRHRSEESVPCLAKSNVVHAHLPVGSTGFDQPTVSLRCIKPTRCQTKQYPCGTSRQSDRRIDSAFCRQVAQIGDTPPKVNERLKHEAGLRLEGRRAQAPPHRRGSVLPRHRPSGRRGSPGRRGPVP